MQIRLLRKELWLSLFLFIFILFLLEFLKENKLLVTVDDISVKNSDLILRKEVYKRCYRINKDEVEILAEIIRDTLQESVLRKKYGFDISESMLKEKSRLIDKNTKDPLKLNCLKSVYGFYKKAYQRNVVKPTLVNPILYQMFLQDNSISQQEKDKVLALIQKVKNNPSILPTLEGYGTFQLNQKQNISNNENLSSYTALVKILDQLKIGEIWHDVVEDNYSFKIVRLLKKNNEIYVWDGVIIPKHNFANWFKDYALGNIKIKIHDETIKRNFLRKYPNLWWKNLFVNF